MEHLEVRPILESLIFASPSPVKLETLLEVLQEWNKETILAEIFRLKEEYEAPSKGLELVEVAGGYQFRTKARWAEWVARLKKAKPLRFSHSALETLAIIAYRQPVIRPDIEEIRGVDSGWILRSLMEKGLIKIVGRKDLPGRPIIYGTTKAFLELFNLNSLSDLPRLKEIQPPPAMEEARRAEELTDAETQTESVVGNEEEAETEGKVDVTFECMDDRRGMGSLEAGDDSGVEAEVTIGSTEEVKFEAQPEEDPGQALRQAQDDRS